MKTKQAALMLSVATAIAIGAGAEHAVAAASQTSTHAAHHKTSIAFTAKRETVHQVDVAPAGQSIGDETYLGGKIMKGNVRGYTTAQCATVTTEDHNLAQCQVDLVLRHGTVITIGTSNDTSPVLKLAVVGGTGRYARASGSGTLRPTSAGSVVALRLR
jgi:hypothetical protein